MKNNLYYKDSREVEDQLKDNAQEMMDELEKHGKSDRFTKLCYQQLMQGLWLQTDPNFQR